MEKELERFDVVGEDSFETTVITYQQWVKAGSLNSPNKIIPGLKRFVTIDGDDCNFISDNEFEIVNLGIIVKKT